MIDTSEIRQRLGIGGLFALCFCALLFLYPYAPWDSVFVLILTLLTLLGMREYGHFVEAKGAFFDRLWAYTALIGYVSVHTAVLRGYLPQQAQMLLWWSIFFSLLCLALVRSKRGLTEPALTFFGFCYVVMPLSEIATIAFTPVGEDDLRLWLFYGIVLTKLADTGALFIGRFCGRHLLAPQMSPKKTWEGALGGIFVGLLFSLAFCFIAKHYGLKFSLSYLEALVLGIFLPFFGQIGDMVESLFKRDVGIKDSGSLPGLGGILDLVDSLIFTMPILACFLRLRG